MNNEISLVIFLPFSISTLVQAKSIWQSGLQSKDCVMKAECLVHFSYEKSQVMLVDIQGAGMKLCDPEIASSELLSEDQQYLYCAGNMSLQPIGNFVKNLSCNRYCKAVQLSALS